MATTWDTGGTVLGDIRSMHVWDGINSENVSLSRVHQKGLKILNYLSMFGNTQAVGVNMIYE